jgi:hypothetical protein
MATIVTRAAKGTPLTHVEVDANFTNLNSDKVEAGAVVAKTSATGSAVIPSGTTGQQDGSPSAGYLRFNTTDTSFEGYDGSAWGSIGGGATSDAIYENSATITEDITIVTGRNGMSTGPISVASGITVTVESGARYVVI